MTIRLQGATPGVAVALALMVAGCAAATSPSSSAAQSASASAEMVTVSIVDASFGPDITVPARTTVLFVNNDGLRHTASHGTDGQLVEDWLFDLTLEPGASDSFTFDMPGTYPITCVPHPVMNMTITVE
jgi:plastocyanin